MSAGYRIRDVADRSGFSAPTLRYYEQIGLLPEATRTPAGYRLYDDRTLDRLAFIARAKQLGCSLDEIAIWPWPGTADNADPFRTDSAGLSPTNWRPRNNRSWS